MTSPASVGLTDVHDSCRLFAGLRANRAAGWHNGCETQHAIADLLACRSEGDSSSEAKARRDTMGFGASLPADGQRQKARAAPGRPVAQSKVGLRTDGPELPGARAGLRDGRPSLRPREACAPLPLVARPREACATAVLRCANFPVLRTSEQQITQFSPPVLPITTKPQFRALSRSVRQGRSYKTGRFVHAERERRRVR